MTSTVCGRCRFLHLAVLACFLVVSAKVHARTHQADDLPGWLGERSREREAGVKAKGTRMRQFERLKAAKGQLLPDQGDEVSGSVDNAEVGEGDSLTWTVHRASGELHYHPGLPSATIAPKWRGVVQAAVSGGMEYMHMLTLAHAPHNRSMVAAWQGAPGEEGAHGQRIFAALSQDSDGRTWWPARAVADAPQWRLPPTAQWGPVLHCQDCRPASSEAPTPGPGRLWLFFSQSVPGCLRPAPTESKAARWVVGGDVLAAVYDPQGESWSEPKVLYAQDAGGIPKVTANSLTVLQDGTWMLPFWRQRPRPVVSVDPSNNASEVQCVPRKLTSAGVLVSVDGGSTWHASGALGTSSCLHPKSQPHHAVLSRAQLECGAAGWLIENTLAQLKDGSLLMMFRSRSGFVYQTTSSDGGNSWSMPRMNTQLPNPDSKVNLKRLSSGLLALAFNDHQRPVVESPAEGAEEGQTRARRRLSVALSDDGEEWVRVARVDDQSSGSLSTLQLHYPSILERDENNLAIGFTKSELQDAPTNRDLGGGDSQSHSTGYELQIAEFDLGELYSVYEQLKSDMLVKIHKNISYMDDGTELDHNKNTHTKSGPFDSSIDVVPGT